MRKNDLLELLHGKLNSVFTEGEIWRVLEAFFDAIPEILATGDNVALYKIGKFEMALQSARECNPDPVTGKSVRVPAKNKVKFRPSKSYHERLPQPE